MQLVTDAQKLTKLVQKQNFKTSIVINDNVVAVSMNKLVVKMDRPLYVGMSILDISKILLYDFHYNKMVSYYGRNQIGIIYMDTDSLIYWVKTNDLYEDIRTFAYQNEFDFSDYPPLHPNYSNANKKVLGKFKDEANGTVILEIIALMSKMNAIKLQCTEEEDTVVVRNQEAEEKGVKKELRE